MKYKNPKTGEVVENIIKARDQYILHLMCCRSFRELAEAMGYEAVPEEGEEI